MKKVLFSALFLFSVSWRVEFTPNGEGKARSYPMKYEFKTLKEAQRFIDWHPKGKYWCESKVWGGNGLCELFDFSISGADR